MERGTNYGFIIYTNYGFIITRRRQDDSYIYTSQDDKISGTGTKYITNYGFIIYTQVRMTR